VATDSFPRILRYLRLGAAPGATVGTILFDSERKAVIHRAGPRFERVQRNSVARVFDSLRLEGNTRYCAKFMVKPRCSAVQVTDSWHLLRA
jgi:hypothetical protein